MNALPTAFTERMNRQLGDELPDFLRAMEEEPYRGIRINPMKPFDGMDAYTGGERILWAEDGYYLPAESQAGATVFHEAGAFYLQEPAAMLPGEVMDVHPGERILDLCSAPGGKATQMGLKLRGEGLLVCNEPVAKRAQILSRNIERMGIPNSVVISAYPDRIPQSWSEVFDGVLVDAPCSGEGMFRRDPETRSEWSPEKAEGCAKRQLEILCEASRFVRPGGRLVYAPCTYNPLENTEVIHRFLQMHPEFSPEPFRLPGAEGKDGMLLCFPNRMKGEGQFAAKLREKGLQDPLPLGISLPPAGRREADLLCESIPGIARPNSRFGNTLVWMPECPDLNGIKVLRAGLSIAEMRGAIPIPDHAAALCCFSNRKDFHTIRKMELKAAQAADFIAGKEIEGEEKGWMLMTFRGLAIGWGKGSSGRVRNHYPKGLRKDRILTETV